MKKSVLAIILLYAFKLFTQECGIIYVSPTGAGSGLAGTRANPANLVYGLSLVSAQNSRLWLATGTYNLAQPLQLVSNITIEGGFDAATWVKSNATPSILAKDATNVLPLPANALVGIAGLNISNFRLQDITIQVAAAVTAQTSVYGIYLSGCSNYNIVRCVVTTGAAGAGMNGTTGNAGVAGGAGGNGVAGNTNELFSAGGVGGIGSGGNNGGAGGMNGRWNGSSPPGSAGLPSGCGGAGGSSGLGPKCSFPYSCSSCGGVTAGQSGSVGQSGSAGANGAVGPQGSMVGGYFVPGGAGTNGSNGSNGCGGGGGGGGGGRQQQGSDYVGGAGGGGGGGGGGGTGGSGGTGGGSSFCIFLFNNGANGVVRDCALNVGAGGAGGTGGAGGVGGAGGAGGQGGAAGNPCSVSVGGNGGAGGSGGAGGNGGSGATGLSIALSENGGTAVSQQNIVAVPGNPPIISVENRGCINAEVTFSSAAAGNWNFGNAAFPATASGSGPHKVIYNTLGRKTIQFSGVDFTEFVDIFNNSLQLPSITAKSSTHFTGCPDSFSTSLVGSLYEWDFGQNSLPQTVQSSSAATAGSVFLIPGQRVIKVWVTTDCCGRVYDSLVLNVQQSSLNINLQASDDTVCAGENVTFTAAPATYVNYRFFLNGVEVQNSANPIYSNANLQNGDSVYVIAFDGSCFTNVSIPIVMTVHAIPSVSLVSSDADSSICAGESVVFTANPSGLDQYIFSNNGSAVQTSGASTYTTSALVLPNSISVVAVQNGCSSAVSSSIATTVNPIPVATLVSSDTNDTICVGDNIVFTANPTGMANYEFFVNGISVQSSGVNSISSSILPDGAAVYVIATNNGCVSNSSDTIVTTVIPIPAVTLSVSDTAVCAGEPVVFTAAPSGYLQYDFKDGSNVLQQTSFNTYATSLLQPGNSVTVTPTHYGCVGSASNAVSVTIFPSPTVDAGSNFSVCADTSDITLSGFSPGGALWSGVGIANASGVFSAAVSGVGVFNLALEYTANGCTGRDTIQATVNSLPNTFAGSDVSICAGGLTQLTASGGVVYAWEPAAFVATPTSANTDAMPASTTVFSVRVTDANQCVASDSVVVTVEPNPVVSFSVQVSCATQPIAVTNTSVPDSATFDWNFGNGTTMVGFEPVYSYPQAGNYTVTLTAVLGNCSATAVQNVNIAPFPVADFSAAPLLVVQDEDVVMFENLSADANSFVWNFGDGGTSTETNPSYLYKDTGTFSVMLMASSQQGCIDTLERTMYVKVIEKSFFFIPNLFSPNGDGNNDLFKVIAQGVARFDLRIFNRWGEQVFQSYDVNQAWDGYYRGELCFPGTYTYVLKVMMRNGDNQKRKGSLFLLR